MGEFLLKATRYNTIYLFISPSVSYFLLKLTTHRGGTGLQFQKIESFMKQKSTSTTTIFASCVNLS